MKTIPNPYPNKMVIHFDRIVPFRNVCKVTGVEERCNIMVDYVPDKKLIDITDYRRFFEKGFNDLIEGIAHSVYDEIMKSAEPFMLRVTVYLEDNPRLTNWCCTVSSEQL